MDFFRCTKGSFTVIGKEGSTDSEERFIIKLWQDSNSHFDEIADLVKRDKNGNILGIWGAMSDFSRSFAPWENGLSRGLYLAGAECYDDAQPPQGWVKWVIPTFEYVYAKAEGGMTNSIQKGLEYLRANGLELVGAIQEYYCPEEDSRLYLFFPIKRFD